MPPSTSKPTYPPSSRSSCQAWCRCGRCPPCLTASNLQWRHSKPCPVSTGCFALPERTPNATKRRFLSASGNFKLAQRAMGVLLDSFCRRICIYQYDPVGGWPTPLKNMTVNGKDYPIYYGKPKMFQTTNQWLVLSGSVFWRWPHILGAKRSAKGTANPSWTERREIVEESRIFSGQHWAVLPLQGWWRLPKSRAS